MSADYAEPVHDARDEPVIDTRSDFVRVLDVFVVQARAELRVNVSRLVAAEELQQVVSAFRRDRGREPLSEADLIAGADGPVARARTENLIDRAKGRMI